MGQTLAEQILSHKAGTAVRPGDMIVIEPDVAMGHDSLSPGIIKIMQERLKADHVHNPEQVVLVMDHVSPGRHSRGGRQSKQGAPFCPGTRRTAV